MNIINVKSEIGRLRKVMVHRPGKELEHLTPKLLSSLLFDDIPWLELAQKEHDQFVELMREHGVEVLYLEDLVVEALSVDPKIKNEFIDLFVEESNIITPESKKKLHAYLHSIADLKELVLKTMSGVLKTELPSQGRMTLTEYIRDYPFICDPMPNLYFTRDPFFTIDQGVAISKMHTRIRHRETIYGHFIFTYHPEFKNASISRFYDRDFPASIEGGDVLILSEEILAIGVSQRTHPASIEEIARKVILDDQSPFKKILAFDIPKVRAFMHLDTVFTQVDYGTFLVHSGARLDMNVYEITGINKEIHIKPIHGTLQQILEDQLNQEITIISCGGDDEIAADREQWSDGANSLAIAPGEIIVYGRNYITNKLLKEHGIKAYPISASELSRGRGGPRCMSMPFVREKLEK